MAVEFKYPVRILEKYLDVFGHVNNSTYLELYEEARWEMITQNGFGYDVIKEKKMGPVILGLNLRFKKELLGRDKIIIHTKYNGMRNSKIMKLSQWMTKDDGQLASTLDIEAGLFCTESRKLLAPTSLWFKAIGIDSKEEELLTTDI